MSAAGDTGGRGDGDGEGDGEWRFGLDEVGPEAEEAGPEPVEPGDLDRENVLFFVLGVTFALVVFASLFL